jgi:hypothetical protein
MSRANRSIQALVAAILGSMVAGLSLSPAEACWSDALSGSSGCPPASSSSPGPSPEVQTTPVTSSGTSGGSPPTIAVPPSPNSPAPVPITGRVEHSTVPGPSLPPGASAPLPPKIVIPYALPVTGGGFSR